MSGLIGHRGLLLNSGGPATDPFFSSVVLLCHFEGANASTTLTDSSSHARTSTAFGDAQLTTTAPLTGLASGLFDGNGDNWTFPNSTDFDFGAGSFTMEGQATIDSLSKSVNWLLSNRPDTTGGGFFLRANNSGLLQIDCIDSSGSDVFTLSSNPGVITAATPFKWAICRDATTNNTYWFIDGVLVVTATATAYTLGASVEPLWVGSSSGETGSRDWPGKMDELRITKGVCRYTATYTPSAAPFPDA